MKVAIVGGGLTGCLTALEFGERGHDVVLFDKGSELMGRATTANEGKVHLGYVYAADQSFRTAERLIDDALMFRAALEKWMTSRELNACLYDNFDYVVPKSSNLSVERIQHHFRRVEAHIGERMRTLKLDYLGQTEPSGFFSVEPPSSTSLACFRTQERGVWPIGLANIIRNCLSAHPRIQVETGVEVVRFEADAEKWKVEFSDKARRPDGPFGIVVNAAWADRRNIDRNSGYADDETWFTRFKFGVLLEHPSSALAGELPRNATALSGSYGDSVYFPQDGTLYCSWYPIGMCFSTSEQFHDSGRLKIDEQERLIQDTWRGYATIDHWYHKLDKPHQSHHARLIGDFIVAKGKSGIEDPASQLHQRVGHGALELDKGYWTVETGKFTSSPRCAIECVESALASY